MTTPSPPLRSSEDPASGPAPRIPASLAWRPGPTLIFVAMLVGLLLVGLLVRGTRPARPVGLPADTSIAAARALLADGLPLPTRELFLVTTLAGEARGMPGDSIPVDRLAVVRGRLREAARRHPGDARIACALAHVDLAAGRLAVAERGYRWVLGRAPTYGEARLGLGVTLALQAGQEYEPVRVRAKRLAALGQVANVEEGDPAYEAAVVDRLVLLRAVGRGDDAARVAAAALAAGLAEPWAARVRPFAEDASR